MTPLKRNLMARTGGTAGLLIAAGSTLCIIAIACLGWLLSLKEAATKPLPSPVLETYDAKEENSGPVVDWSWWKETNPDVIGWVSIAGTSISQPIVQAQANDPDRYLDHDVFGNLSPWGCVYLDAECKGGLFGSKNALVYGHHTKDGTMFSEIARYADPAWAHDHTEVVVQTPDETRRYLVRFARVIDGGKNFERIRFESDKTFDAWYEEELHRAASVVDTAARPDQTITLITCSYSRFADERTMVVCSEA